MFNFIISFFILSFVLLFKISQAHAQCVNPAGTIGKIVYNSTYDVFQGCTNVNGWVAFHKPGGISDPCAGTPNIGDTCADGTLYAGNLSGTDRYITPADDSTGVLWGCSGTNIATANSTTDGEANTNQIMLSCPGSAAAVCANLTAHGHSDWYLPASTEYAHLHTNRVALGMNYGFTHWTSQNSSSTQATRFRFSDGTTFIVLKNTSFYVRCMRK